MNDCPCGRCTAETGRTPTCKFDGTCDKYSTWNEKHIEQNRKIRSEREKDNLYRSYIAETSARNNKRRAHGDKRR